MQDEDDKIKPVSRNEDERAQTTTNTLLALLVDENSLPLRKSYA